MSIVYNQKKASDLIVSGQHMREAWINGEKIWPADQNNTWKKYGPLMNKGYRGIYHDGEGGILLITKDSLKTIYDPVRDQWIDKDYYLGPGYNDDPFSRGQGNGIYSGYALNDGFQNTFFIYLPKQDILRKINTGTNHFTGGNGAATNGTSAIIGGWSSGLMYIPDILSAETQIIKDTNGVCGVAYNQGLYYKYTVPFGSNPGNCRVSYASNDLNWTTLTTHLHSEVVQYNNIKIIGNYVFDDYTYFPSFGDYYTVTRYIDGKTISYVSWPSEMPEGFTPEQRTPYHLGNLQYAKKYEKYILFTNNGFYSTSNLKDWVYKRYSSGNLGSALGNLNDVIASGFVPFKDDSFLAIKEDGSVIIITIEL